MMRQTMAVVGVAAVSMHSADAVKYLYYIAGQDKIYRARVEGVSWDGSSTLPSRHEEVVADVTYGRDFDVDPNSGQLYVARGSSKSDIERRGPWGEGDGRNPDLAISAAYSTGSMAIDWANNKAWVCKGWNKHCGNSPCVTNSKCFTATVTRASGTAWEDKSADISIDFKIDVPANVGNGGADRGAAPQILHYSAAQGKIYFACYDEPAGLFSIDTNLDVSSVKMLTPYSELRLSATTWGYMNEIKSISEAGNYIYLATGYGSKCSIWRVGVPATQFATYTTNVGDPELIVDSQFDNICNKFFLACEGTTDSDTVCYAMTGANTQTQQANMRIWKVEEGQVVGTWTTSLMGITPEYKGYGLRLVDVTSNFPADSPAPTTVPTPQPPTPTPPLPTPTPTPRPTPPLQEGEAVCQDATMGQLTICKDNSDRSPPDSCRVQKTVGKSDMRQKCSGVCKFITERDTCCKIDNTFQYSGISSSSNDQAEIVCWTGHQRQDANATALAGCTDMCTKPPSSASNTGVASFASSVSPAWISLVAAGVMFVEKIIV